MPVDDPRVRHDLEPDDLATVPPWRKEYADDLPVVELPRDLPDPGVSAAAVLAGRPVSAQPLDAAQLARVLFLGAGVGRFVQRGERRILFRASGSAGAQAQAAGERDKLERICLGQSLGAEAAYVVISTADPAALDDRAYRDAQLASGMVEGRLHLAAYATGISASAMTFLDSEVPALLGHPFGVSPDDLVTLLFTCVGVPQYTSRPRGRPGEPATFKPVLPRMVEE